MPTRHQPNNWVSPWWESDEDDLHTELMGHVEALEEAQGYQHELNIRNARLYANSDMLGLDWALRERDFGRKPLGRVTENVIQSACDTATSMISHRRARATIQTEGGQFSVQQRAKKLEQFLDGVFEYTKFHDTAVDVFRDAVVFGTGFMKIFSDGDKLAVERVIPDEIKVDELEARTGSPRSMYQVKFVDKYQLADDFPEHAEQIMDAGREQFEHYQAYRRGLDPSTVLVIEAWHLRSGSKHDDSCHALIIDGTTLFKKSWPFPYFPFLEYRWSKPVVGFYGQGLSEQLTGIQLRINQLNHFIQRCQDLIAVPRVFVDIGSKNMKMQISNEIGAVIPYRGKPPVFMTPQAVSPEIYQYKESLWRRAYEITGIQQMGATGMKPAGLESAVALREYNDIGTQRFSVQAQRWENLVPEAAHRFIDLAKRIYRGKRKEATVKTFNKKRLIEKISWGDVDLDKDVFVISVEAASILSRTPAGRTQQVVELAQGGVIDQDEARRLLDHPDLRRSMDIQLAAIEDIEAAIEDCLNGDYRPPEPFQDLASGIKRFQMAYLKARRDNAPPEILDLLIRWMEAADYLMKKQQLDEQMQLAEMQASAQQQAMAEQAPPLPAGEDPNQPMSALAPNAMMIKPTGLPS